MFSAGVEFFLPKPEVKNPEFAQHYVKQFGLGVAVHMKVGFTKILTTPDI